MAVWRAPLTAECVTGEVTNSPAESQASELAWDPAATFCNKHLGVGIAPNASASAQGSPGMFRDGLDNRGGRPIVDLDQHGQTSKRR
jgi:hypothetical protein